jgi:hypothetical protein
MEAVNMAESINFFQLNLSMSVSSFSQSAVSGSNSARSAGSTSAGRSAAAIGINGGAGTGVIDINNSRSNMSSSDGIVISDSARALEFLSNSLVKNGFSHAEAEVYTSRYAQDPELDGELSRLFTLLEPLFDDKSKFRENVEKFMANFARMTGRAPSRQISASLQDIASKIENIKNNKDTVTASAIAAVEVSVEITIVEGKVEFIQRKQTDPLILDMDANGFDLTSADDGAEFDIDADGNIDKTAVTRGNDAMLALDLNGNGVIDNGKELFGDQNGAKDGFAELAKYDENADGIIDSRDGIFDGLKLLRFVKNSAGGYEQKITTLKSSGITAIDLLNISGTKEEINGNSIFKKSSAYINNNINNIADIADALLENYRL